MTANSQDTAFRIHRVKFIGVKNVPKKELARNLTTQPYTWWKIWQAEETLTVSDLDDDLQRIEQFYQNHGYYHAHVVYDINRIKKPVMEMNAANIQGQSRTPPPQTSDGETDKEGEFPLVSVNFIITEGPPVVIKTISVRIEPEFKEITEQDLLSLLPVQIGQILNIANYRESKNVIQKALGSKGYPLSDLKGHILVNTDENSAEITFGLNPGKKFKFGPLSFEKSDGYVKEAVLRRAVTFEKGEVYSTDDVEKSQRNLYALDVFKATVIKPGKPVPGSDEIPMSAQLKPKKRRSVKLGIGYGSEDRLRASIAWTYRNLMGWGGRFSLSARRSDLIQNAEIAYLQPYFLEARNTLRSASGFEREKLVSYTNRKVFGNFTFDRKLSKYWTATTKYDLEVNQLEDINITVPDEIKKLVTENSYLVSSIGAALKLNSTDSEFNPSKGSVASAALELAPSILGSEVTFYSPAFEFRQFYQLPKSVVLAGRVRFQFIQKMEGTEIIPINKRLFLGGSKTVRGYEYQKLGPLDSAGNPIGGLTSLNANLELRFPVYKEFGGVTFLDMGSVHEGPHTIEWNEMRYSTGVGIRYNTLIGPMRLDFGYKLNPQTRELIGDTENPDEELGKRWRIHFSIGQAF
ncbi:outer membrane protein assembly factor BamA [Thermodesulfobacteriota bacterium]